ncbi:Lrp/AsnC family transcriptional regulator [Parasphingorhabdus sp.]|jgi:Lrp/AsnC family transcriptional regulator, leucine-responsive regulatory protein|uniref:Lrp/AsnC family transcriptional regulator n=1 Tax=Parasphingorhabdus sp. TaxID=2709688 RepID=UPI003BB04FD7
MIELDTISRKILQVLEQDGRISNTDLAAKVGLSASACLRRVQDMERKGLIKGYRAVLDPAVRGAAITIFVMVGLSEHLRKDALAFEQAVAHAPEVRECHNITGSVEYLLRVEVADLAAYKDFHADILGTLPQVSSITSHICLGSPTDKRA